MKGKPVYYQTEDDELTESKGSVLLPDKSVEPSIDALRKAVKESQYCTFQFGKRQLLVDVMTANRIVQAYDRHDDEVKARMERMMNKSYSSFLKMVVVIWS